MNKLVLGLLVCTLGGAACGDDGSKQLADAPVAPDAAVDAAPDTPVTLTVTLDGLPVADVDVYFVNPDGSLVAKVPTGADGIASAVVASGASVTALDPFPGRSQTFGGPPIAVPDLRTFMGVKPGDHLRLSATQSSISVQVTVTLPIDGVADAYELHSSCGGMQSIGSQGSGSTPTGTVFLSDCGGTTDLLAIAYSNGSIAGWLYKADVAVADQGVVDLSAETYQTTTPDVTLTYSNIPTAYATIDVRTQQASSRGQVWEAFYTVDTVGGMAMQTFQRPPVPGALTLSLASLGRFGGDRTGHEVFDWGPATMTTFDLAGALLHDYTADPTFTTTTRTLAWSAATAGTAPDLIVTGIYVTDPTQTMSYRWRIAAPYGGTTLALPNVPAEAFPFAPSAQDMAFVDDLATAKVPGGYDAVRANVLAVGGPEDLAVSASGRISVAYAQQMLVGRKAPRGIATSRWGSGERARARR